MFSFWRLLFNKCVFFNCREDDVATEIEALSIEENKGVNSDIVNEDDPVPQKIKVWHKLIVNFFSIFFLVKVDDAKWEYPIFFYFELISFESC